MKYASTLLSFLLPFMLFSQSAYEKGWAALDNRDVMSAVRHFEQAVQENSSQTDAELMLALLYPRIEKDKEARQAFKNFYGSADDPIPASYALLFEECVFESAAQLTAEHYPTMQMLMNDPRRIGKTDGDLLYRAGAHHTFSFDTESGVPYFEALQYLADWQVLGPFDNVMNSGFNKDFGAVTFPKDDHKFKSKYGATVTWFDPEINIDDGYFFKDTYFLSANSLIYAQCFVFSENEQEVILKSGYSGSLKLWLNDHVIYEEASKRVTSNDYLQFHTVLKKGWNRVLVQLGDYNESTPNFSVRFTDRQHKPLSLKNTPNYQEYSKDALISARQEHFAERFFNDKVHHNSDDRLSSFLLYKTYLRALDLNNAKKVLLEGLSVSSDNYLFLRNAVLFYEVLGNTTEQNRYYERFKKLYPHDHEILVAEIDNYSDQDNKDKVKELVEIYNETYDHPYQHILNAMIVSNLEENYMKSIALIDSLYSMYPHVYDAMNAKFYTEKNLNSDPEKAREVLLQYLEGRYNFKVIGQLANDYLADGKVDDAIEWLKKSVELAKYDHSSRRKLVNIYSRQKMYDEAIDICSYIVKNRPSDYETLKDLALLHTFNDEEEKSLDFFEKSLQYFPFSFENNERIRALEGKKTFTNLLIDADVDKIIEEYESEFIAPILTSYDIVYDHKSVFIGKTRAHGYHREYIIKIKTDNGLSEWQSANFSTTSNFRLDLIKYETIKADGSKIQGERNGADVVFTKLEVGDYIHVVYSERQFRGGKSSLFIHDEYALTSYTPSFIKKYNVYTEEDIELQYALMNGADAPQVSDVDDLKLYSWEVRSAPLITEENYVVPFNDVASKVYVTSAQTWEDIVQWYADLSNHQAVPDFTIESIVDTLIDINDSQEIKAKKIYKFICDNIQYSSIDFRQGSYIPQKASDVYHTRLGDCKDMSTLYASMARASGLDANLVLINTSDNGDKSVALPSLEFNHCIVKVVLDGQDHFVELTDSDLPFGHLYYYHDGAAILEIPQEPSEKVTGISTLTMNPGYTSGRKAITDVRIGKDLVMHVSSDVLSTGSNAGSLCTSYYYEDEKQKLENKKQIVSSYYESTVTLNSLSFPRLAPLLDTAQHMFQYDVSDDVIEIGSFKSVKIPFAVTLLEKGLLQQDPRVNDFYFKYYEGIDRYEDVITITLEDGLEFLESPEAVRIDYKGFTYDMTATLAKDNVLEINRIYVADRKNIPAEDYESFKVFVDQVIDAERTQLVFK